MKKLSIILLFFSFLPSFAKALFIAPSASITTVVNTGAHEGLFAFDLERVIGNQAVDSNQFDIQTENFSGSQTISVIPGTNVIYRLSENIPNGYILSNADCMSDNSSDIFTKIGNEMIIKLSNNSNVTCVFNHSEIDYKTPILIVPGVLGTDLSEGSSLLWANEKMTILPDTFMDNLSFNKELTPSSDDIFLSGVIRSKTFLGVGLHFTDGLISDFISQGYVEGKDLFTFPYDWRYGASGKDENGDSVNLKAFEGQMNYILTQTDAGKSVGKVDVIAHSTGGLIAKQYIVVHPTDHNIDKLVMVGVPNLGSPKAVKVLLQGDNFGVPGLSDAEMKKLGLNMPVVYDLAPSQKYYQQAGSYLHVKNSFDPSGPINMDLNFSDTWSWMEDRNFANSRAVDLAQALHDSDFDNYDLAGSGVDLYNIVGCTAPTFSKINITVNKSGSGFSFDDLKLVTGDGTVPMASAESIQANADHTFYAVGISHGNLLSANGSRQEIVSLVSNSNLSVDPTKILTKSTLDKDSSLCNIKKGKFLGIFSPVAISVTDQDGKTAQVTDNGSINNQIPGSDYEVWGDHKFVFLPQDSGQTYTTNLIGTGNGTFTLQSSDFDNGQISNTQAFANVPVTTQMSGQLILNDLSELDWNNQVLAPGDYKPAPVQTISSSGSGGWFAPIGKVLGETKLVSVASGKLILDFSDKRTVWLVVGDSKYGFTSERVFKGLGLKFENVVIGDVSKFQVADLITADNFLAYK